jgi:hypothetical protein
MSPVRITIGGMDVNSHPGEAVGGALSAPENQGIAGVDRIRDGEHASVILTAECTPRLRCPLPPGPWRIISALVLLVALLSLVSALCRRRRCCDE